MTVAYQVRVESLIDHLQNALKVVDYSETAIELKGESGYRVREEGGDNQQGFTCLVDLTNGSFKLGYGSLDRDSFFSRNSIDIDYRIKTLKPEFAVIKGQVVEGKAVEAIIILNDKLFKNLLGADKIELTPQQRLVLETIHTFKKESLADEFRNKRLGSYSGTNPLIQTLVTKGLLRIYKKKIRLTKKGRDAI